MTNLVVGINPGYWEWEYVTKFLFPDSNIIQLQNDTPVLENPVIVYSSMNSQIDEKTYAYINKYPDKSFVLVHLSNEWAYGYKPYISSNSNFIYPIYQRAKHVFRQYWHPLAEYDNVTTIPVGWKSGFYSAEKQNVSLKVFDAAFFGQLKNDRFEMVNVMNTLKKSCYVWTTEAFGSKDCASVEQQISIYQNSNVVPCPAGNCHPDTFRICEALESGSIPVLRNYLGFEYHTKVFGESTPIPKIYNWSDLPGLIEEIKGIGVKNLYDHIQEWYLDYKKKLTEKIKTIISY